MLDMVGSTASLLSTYYFIRLNSKAWIISLFAICINGWLFWQKGIYAEMVLECCYFLTTCYGWFLWRHVPAHIDRRITYLSPKHWLMLVITVFSLFLLIRTLLSTFTLSTVATLDALTTALSLAAQWLMCHKVIATWVVWLVTDAIYTYLYLQKDIPFHALLMLIYIGFAMTGYYSWLLAKTKSEPASNCLAG